MPDCEQGIEEVTAKVIPTASAEEFVHLLRRNNPQWGTDFESPWIFRGQGNADRSWRLCPSLLRPTGHRNPALNNLIAYWEAKVEGQLDSISKSCPKWRAGDIKRAIALVTAQVDAVHQFVTLCDRLGYLVPESANYLHPNDCFKNLVRNPREEPKPGYGAALAQHHGIPTSLLDWTENSLIAGFFACRNRCSSAKYVAVWALKTDQLENTKVDIVRVPRHGFEFIHAQQGLFTWDGGAVRQLVECGRTPDLTEVLQEQGNTSKTLLKITMPADQCPAALKELWRYDINDAYLMPRPENAAKALEMKWGLQNSVAGRDSQCENLST